MKPAEAETLNGFSKRSNRTVTYITLAFALGGAFADLLSHALPAFFGSAAGIGLLWGLWIPFCFLTIPPIHYLCRQAVSLHERLEALEKRAGQPSPGDAG